MRTKKHCTCDSATMLSELVNYLFGVSRDSARFVAAARLRGVGVGVQSFKVPKGLKQALELTVLEGGVPDGVEESGLGVGQCARGSVRRRRGER